MFDNQLDILKYLIQQRLFAPSPSALAAKLGYKGRTTLYRLLNNTVKNDTVGQVWKDICEVFGLSDERMAEIALITEKGKWLCNLMADYPIEKLNPMWAEHLLCALVDEDYSLFPVRFKDEVVPQLKELKLLDENTYYGMLMLFYVTVKGIDPYRLNFKQTLCDLIIDLNEFFHSVHPENETAYKAIQALKTEPLLKIAPACLWGLIDNPMMILQYYADPLFINTALRQSTVFTEWGDISYWRQSGKDFGKGEKLWIFMCRKSDSIYHGSYIVQELKIGKDNETFIPQKFYTIAFWNKEWENDEYDAIIQISLLPIPEEDNSPISYALYKYKEDSDEILIAFDEECDNIYHFPHNLKRIRLEQTSNQQDKVWAHLIYKFDKKGAMEIFSNNLCQALHVEYLEDEYAILDVGLTRKYFSILVKQEKKMAVLRIKLDAYSFLKNLSPNEELVVCKHYEQLYVEWPWLGYAIPLTDFEFFEYTEQTPPFFI